VSGPTALAVTLSVLAGLAGPVQAAVMGELGERVGIVPALALSALVTTAVALSALVVVRGSTGGLLEAFRQPAWLWIGGVLSAFIVVSVTVAPPRIGTTATIGVIIAGNLAMAAAIDRFGLFGLPSIRISWPRLLGIGLLALGAALSLHRD
jgi:bacterial/archaeal transporter family-2 protein